MNLIGVTFQLVVAFCYMDLYRFNDTIPAATNGLFSSEIIRPCEPEVLRIQTKITN